MRLRLLLLACLALSLSPCSAQLSHSITDTIFSIDSSSVAYHKLRKTPLQLSVYILVKSEGKDLSEQLISNGFSTILPLSKNKLNPTNFLAQIANSVTLNWSSALPPGTYYFQIQLDPAGEVVRARPLRDSKGDIYLETRLKSIGVQNGLYTQGKIKYDELIIVFKKTQGEEISEIIDPYSFVPPEKKDSKKRSCFLFKRKNK